MIHAVFRVEFDRLIAAEAAGAGAPDFVSHFDEFAFSFLGKSEFEEGLAAVDAGGACGLRRADVLDAGRIARFLQVHAEIDQIDEDLHVSLRLHSPPITPNETSGAPSFVTNPGMIVWNGRLPGARRSGVVVESEKFAAILQRKSEPVGNHARAESAIVALDQRNHVAVRSATVR